MKILHVVQYLAAGGLEKMVLNLASYQKKHGHEVAIYVYDDKQSWVNLARALGIQVYSRHKKKSFDFFVLGDLIRYSESYDIIHAHDLGPLVYTGLASLLARFKLLRPRFVLTLHGLVHQSYKEKIYFKFFLPLMDGVAAVSEEIFYYLNFASLAKKTLIKNGVSLLVPVQASPIKTVLNLPAGDQVVISVARLLPLKNQEMIIRAVNDCDNCQLLLVGPETDHDYVSKLKALAGPRIHFLGERLDIGELLKASNLFVSASTQEGLPLSVLEAFACKTPVILSHIKGHEEFFNNNMAASFSLNDLNDLKTKIILARTNVEAGYLYVKEFYSTETMALNYVKFYRDL